jgi:hypothetical protein
MVQGQMMEKVFAGGPNGAFAKGILAAVAAGTVWQVSPPPTPTVWSLALQWIA